VCGPPVTQRAVSHHTTPHKPIMFIYRGVCLIDKVDIQNSIVTRNIVVTYGLKDKRIIGHVIDIDYRTEEITATIQTVDEIDMTYYTHFALEGLLLGDTCRAFNLIVSDIPQLWSKFNRVITSQDEIISKLKQRITQAENKIVKLECLHVERYMNEHGINFRYDYKPFVPTICSGRRTEGVEGVEGVGEEGVEGVGEEGVGVGVGEEGVGVGEEGVGVGEEGVGVGEEGERERDV